MKSAQIITAIMLFFLLPAFSYKASAQLTVSGAMTPQQLVQNVLLGPGVTATNITYTGATAATGSFNGASSNIGLGSGVLLTSGSLTNAPGPNNIGSSTTVNNLPGDPDLDNIMSPALSNDASVLQFDFIPTGDTVKFRYVFASEEYAEWVSTTGGGINDGFGFFLSGVSTPMPLTNIALIPNTTTPVTINNINCQLNSPYYICNDPANSICSGAYACPTSAAGTTVQYDGFTTVLTAISPVICGETYHIKIAIADGGDWSWDSGVFLEAGSFASQSTVQITSTTTFGGNDTVLYEGCSHADVVFNRGNNNLNTADTLTYTITGSAVNGTDYSPVSSSVVFPAGSDTAVISLDAITDAAVEGTETVTITASFVNPCTGVTTTSSITLYIVDAPPITVTAPSDTFITCPGEVISLSAQASGGVPIGNYRYMWMPGNLHTASINVSPSSTTTYTVSVTDSCGVVSASDQVTVTVLPYSQPQVSVSPVSICLGEDATLVSTVSGGLPPYSLSWSNSLGSNDTVVVSPPVTTTYTVTVNDYCDNQASNTGTVTISYTTASFSFINETNAIVNFTDQSAADVVGWHWLFGDGDSLLMQPDPVHVYNDTGTYTVQLVVMNSIGCTDTAIAQVIVLPDMYFYYPNSFTPNDDGLNDYFAGIGLGIDKYEMIIFNRWGEVIFKSEDMAKGWDGRTKSGYAPNDVYICVFNLVGDVDGVTKKVKHIGKVTLVR
jgi:gliding motility-associated-like protein